MIPPAGDLRALGAAARKAGVALEADVQLLLDRGLHETMRHWQGMASVLAERALAAHARDIDTCVEFLHELGRGLDVLAEAAAAAEDLEVAAARIDAVRETFTDTADLDGETDRLHARAAQVFADADAWCASHLAALAACAPGVVGASYARTAPRLVSVPPVWIPGALPLVLLDSARRALDRESGWVPTRVGFGTDDLADASLNSSTVAADPARPVLAREVASRLVLLDGMRSQSSGQAAIARNLQGDSGSGAQYLLLDASSGLVAESVGDVRTAREVVVLVPGVGTSIAGWHRVSVEIATLYQAIIAAGGRDVAVVGWLGSPAPPDVVHGALQKYAQAGGPRLRQFVEGLKLAPDVRVTVVGHSYGAVTTGTAVRDGLRPDALVGVAAPGFGPGASNTSRLGDVPTFVLTDPRDPINEVRPVRNVLMSGISAGVPYLGSYAADRLVSLGGVGNLGTEPVCLDGAHRLATRRVGDPPVGSAIDLAVHTSYFDEGSFTNEQLAAVALGRAAVDYTGPTC